MQRYIDFSNRPVYKRLLSDKQEKIIYIYHGNRFIMETGTLQKSESGILVEIEELDFSKVKWKLMDIDEGEGWTSELCDLAEIEYKKYLTLVKLFPQKDIVPNKLMDKFWHQHILDTYAYFADCENVFGYFVHHYPYFGMNGEKDKQDLNDSFEETKRLYKETFRTEMLDNESVRCKDHVCHKPSSCACRTPGSCKS